jgi:hypothetical protein
MYRSLDAISFYASRKPAVRISAVDNLPGLVVDVFSDALKDNFLRLSFAEDAADRVRDRGLLACYEPRLGR